MVPADPPGGATLPGVAESALQALRAVCRSVRRADVDDLVDGVPAGAVAAPGSTAEASQVLRVAAEHRLAVVVRGKATKLTWGRPPDRVDLLVDTAAMTGVVEHAAGDLVVVARAGTPLGSLQEALAEAGQRLALDETVPGASLGGTIATATSGPLRVATGTVRDLIIGITVVRPDGVVAKAGGKVVKNVAGYDLPKLFTGSFGTLGLVTEAAFRLHPVPAGRRWVSTTMAEPGEAARLTQAVIQSQLVPAAVEVDWPADRPGEVAVLLEGTLEGVKVRAGAVRDLLGPGATVADHAPAWWGSYFPQRSGINLKITFALSGLAAVLAAARSAAGEFAADVSLRGSAGAGVVFGWLPADVAPVGVSGVVRTLREVCSRYGGTVVVVDAPQALKSTLDVWGPVPGLDLMRRIKDQFDPDHRFAPGRFVGGI